MEVETPETYHGTRYGYIGKKCRCVECKIANKAYAKQLRDDLRAKRERGEMPESLHGTSGGYTNWGCRCADCRVSHAKACSAYNKKKRKAETCES